MIDIREELANRLTLRDDARTDDPEAEWPEMSFELDDCHWQGAEPDVGIMSEYLDDYSLDARVGDVPYTDEAKFAEAVFAAIGPDVTESAEEVAAMIGEYVKREADNAEPPEPDYDDDRDYRYDD